MRTIEIDKELILVEVPKDANYFTNCMIPCQIDYKTKVKFKDSLLNERCSIILYDFWNDIIEIIGLIETPNVDFDFEVDDRWVERYFIAHFYNYLTDKEGIMSKKQSFRTRIQRKIQDAGIELTGNLLLIKKLK